MSEVIEDVRKYLRWNRISADESDINSIQAFIDVLDRKGYRIKVEPKPRGIYYEWVKGLTDWEQIRLRELTVDQLYSFKMCDFMRLRRIGDKKANRIVQKRTAFIRSHPELFENGIPKEKTWN